jgi:ribose-phosphate pyrophosphokinase
MRTASKYASRLGGALAIVHKKRVSGSEVEVHEIIGEVEGRNILMCDDMITTAGTMCSAAKLVKERGAKKIYVGATHGIFAAEAIKRLGDAPIDEVVVTDTVPEREREKGKGKVNIKVLTVANMLGEAIKRIHRDESVSSLFNQL